MWVLVGDLVPVRLPVLDFVEVAVSAGLWVPLLLLVLLRVLERLLVGD